MLVSALLVLAATHPWPKSGPDGGTLAERFAPPAGYTRVPTAAGSFAEWLRSLPLLPDRNTVRLFSGTMKLDQTAHAAVFDIDTGTSDLQQCADAAIRLYAEYLFARGREDICFKATSGDELAWKRFAEGERLVLAAKRLAWQRRAQPSAAYPTFRAYLDNVFTWAGTASLARSLPRVEPRAVEGGDVFLKGGAPGHAVVVVDVAQNARGERVFLLAQSYMPAQQIHVLKNPASESPWYDATDRGKLVTPEWTFERDSLRRFLGVRCP